MNESILIIFAKNPVLGRVKTRLARTIGNEKALEVYCSLLSITRQVTENLPYDKVVFYSDKIEFEDPLWPEDTYLKRLQEQADLGTRMQSAFSWAFDCGYKRACIIGTDCAQLTSEIIIQAFEALRKKDFVLGPANDGGYYLLGMNTMYEKVFQNKQWSTSEVLETTLADIRSYRKQVYLLPELIDVDDEEDLKNSRL